VHSDDCQGITAVPSTLIRICRHYQRAINFAGIFLIAAITVVAGLQVFFRYVVGASLYWSEELMRYMMEWAAFLLAGTAYSRGEMLGFTLFIDMLPPFWRRLALLIGRIAIVCFLAIVVIYGVDFAWRTRQDEATALQISMIWVHTSVTVGSALMILHVVAAQLTGDQPPIPDEGL
jgi:TRAP-type C4-dicarboxylate transport system permease small subunit